MKVYSSLNFASLLTAAVMGLMISSSGFSDETVTAVTQTLAAPKSKVIGTLDLRAEYYSSQGAYDTSNFIEGGYQFTPDVKVTWLQGFDSNIYKSSLDGKATEGLNGIMDQGYLRTRVTNILKSGSLSFAYESRIFAPTMESERANGNITRLYNAFKLIDKVNDTLTLTLVEVMTPQVFKTAGVGSVVNPAFQNRVYFIADVNITSKLSLSLPLLAYQTKYRDYKAGAKNNDSWTSLIYVWPELDYALTDNVTLGFAYVSDNLMKSDLSEFTFSDGFKNATFQIAVTTTL